MIRQDVERGAVSVECHVDGAITGIRWIPVALAFEVVRKTQPGLAEEVEAAKVSTAIQRARLTHQNLEPSFKAGSVNTLDTLVAAKSAVLVS